MKEAAFMNKTWNKAITYGVLNNALLSLGFLRSDGELINAHADYENKTTGGTAERDSIKTPYTAYHHPNCDALIFLPVKDADEVVRPAHYVTVEMDITLYGILSAEAWYNLLVSKRPAAKRTKKADAMPAEAA